MNTQHQSGFTLIELLVVIAIIGILSSVTLATLNVARAKGADAAIKADIVSAKQQLALYYDDNGSYGADATDCTTGLFTDPVIEAAIAHAVGVGGNAAACFTDDGDPAAGLTATSWAISIPLKTDATQSWCVDSADFIGIGVADNTTIPDTASCN